MEQLENIRVACLATNGFEESELIEPIKALFSAGAKVELISLKHGRIQAFRHHDKTVQVEVDLMIDEANPDDYDALLLPGGALNADTLRADKRVQSFVRSIDEQKKPIAVICHAPWILVSSNLVSGRTITSYPTIQDDIRNAGGKWVDREVQLDGNWVSSRMPDDIPAFNRQMVQLISKKARPRAEKVRAA